MNLRLFDPGDPSCFRDIGTGDIQRGQRPTPVWIDMTGDDPGAIDLVGKRLGFHPLAIEDARKRGQRPKVDVYQQHLLVVLYALGPFADGSGRALDRELSLFLMPDVVVTIHSREIEAIDVAARRWAEHCADGGRQDSAMLAYTIADSIVDGYFPVMDEVGERIDELEALMFEHGGADVLQQIFDLKRGLLEMRRVIAPTRDVFNAFTRRELPLLGDQSLAYFQDVYDHVIRVTDTVDAYRDILASVIDVYLSLASNRLNKTVRTLTSASIILMTLALVAGIYGMNFENMPELRWEYGYFAALGGMAALAGLLALVFRWLKWW